MIVENRLMDEDGTVDPFPMNMHVLVVDDDRICLKELENMLRECKYDVTTTTQSTKALEMLRENRNKFDLLISDVNMPRPHMDGFKLLEIATLEMDLPVIMLSEYIDRERVKKAVIHGACDYLTKPPRIQVLKNIWQHVVRRKIHCNDQKKPSNEEKSDNIVDHNKILGQKRKELSEDNGKENAEASTKKKPRLNWNVELHRKFLAAVNQLGFDEAVPKRILQLMNVEGLTIQNISSHLQKYKLGLKKATQQASTTAAFGRSNPYMQMSSIDTYGNNLVDFSSTSAMAIPLEDARRGELHCQEGLIRNMILQDSHNLNILTSPNDGTSSLGNSLDQNKTVCSKRIDASLVGQSNEATLLITKSAVEKFYLDARIKSNDAYISQRTMAQEESVEEDIFGSLDDITSDMVQLDHDEMISMDGEIRFDTYLFDDTYLLDHASNSF